MSISDVNKFESQLEGWYDDSQNPGDELESQIGGRYEESVMEYVPDSCVPKNGVPIVKEKADEVMNKVGDKSTEAPDGGGDEVKVMVEPFVDRKEVDPDQIYDASMFFRMDAEYGSPSPPPLATSDQELLDKVRYFVHIAMAERERTMEHRFGESFPSFDSSGNIK